MAKVFINIWILSYSLTEKSQYCFFPKVFFSLFTSAENWVLQHLLGIITFVFAFALWYLIKYKIYFNREAKKTYRKYIQELEIKSTAAPGADAC